MAKDWNKIKLEIIEYIRLKQCYVLKENLITDINLKKSELIRALRELRKEKKLYFTRTGKKRRYGLIYHE